MSASRRDLLELVADLRATLLSDAARGVRTEPSDPPWPDADAATSAAISQTEDAGQSAFAQAVEGPVEEEAEPPSPPAASTGWDVAAVAARASRRPDHFDDGLGAAGLGAVRADLGDCRRCGLCEGRTTIVFGLGDPNADLMMIGEGPGEQEDRRGEPFVGPAGQTLDKMLEHVLGLRREQVYLANVVKCRPPGNRNPSDEEAAACKPFLFRQVAAVQPRLIVLLGGVALEHVLGIKGIVRNRGREREFRGIPVIPMFHPAYLLRRPEDKRLAFEDLKLIRQRYDELGGRR